jgi:hypothetical protein
VTITASYCLTRRFFIRFSTYLLGPTFFYGFFLGGWLGSGKSSSVTLVPAPSARLVLRE